MPTLTSSSQLVVPSGGTNYTYQFNTSETKNGLSISVVASSGSPFPAQTAVIPLGSGTPVALSASASIVSAVGTVQAIWWSNNTCYYVNFVGSGKLGPPHFAQVTLFSSMGMIVGSSASGGALLQFSSGSLYSSVAPTLVPESQFEPNDQAYYVFDVVNLSQFDMSNVTLLATFPTEPDVENITVGLPSAGTPGVYQINVPAIASGATVQVYFELFASAKCPALTFPFTVTTGSFAISGGTDVAISQDLGQTISVVES